MKGIRGSSINNPLAINNRMLISSDNSFLIITYTCAGTCASYQNDAIVITKINTADGSIMIMRDFAISLSVLTQTSLCISPEDSFIYLAY